MATNAASTQSKRMEYKPVVFDVNEIIPDAPEGEWQASIPRGKCKTQPTKEDRFPMVIVPIRLDKTEEEDEEHQRALGTDLTVFLVFGSKTPRGANMSKVRIRQLCEAADVDLDVIPKEINDGDDLEPLVRALEGKKLTVWTIHRTRSDTGETTTEVRFQDPKGTLKRSDDDDDDAASDDDEEEKPARGAKRPPAKAASKGNGKRR